MSQSMCQIFAIKWRKHYAELQIPPAFSLFVSRCPNKYHFKSKEASKPILYEKHKLSQNRLQNQF